MKTLLPIMAILFGPLAAVAQNSVGTILTGGNSFGSGGTSITYTVGDLCVKTLLANGVTLGQGALSSAVGSSGIAVEVSGVSTVEFKVFPNPTNDHLFIDLGSITVSEVRLRLIDALGRPVAISAQHTGPSRAEINTSMLSNGIYMLSLIGNEQVLSVFKIIKH